MAWSYWVNTGLCSGNLFGETKWCEPYTKKPCDHHTVGPYGPCPATGPTPPCTRTCIKEYPKKYKDDLFFWS